MNRKLEREIMSTTITQTICQLIQVLGKKPSKL